MGQRVYIKLVVHIYELRGEVNGGIMVACLLALTAAAEHADPLEPATGLHHLPPGRPGRCLGGFSSLRTTSSTCVILSPTKNLYGHLNLK